MNSLKQFVITTISIGLSSVLLEATPSQAARLNFSGVFDSGSLAGEQYQGSFSFDETQVTGSGIPFSQEFVSVSDLNLVFLSTTFSESDDSNQPEVAFIGNEFVGLSYNLTNVNAGNIEISLSFIPGFTSVTEAQVVYDSPSFPVGQGEGSGSVAFVEAETVATPEPSSIFTLLITSGWFFGQMGFKKRNSISR